MKTLWYKSKTGLSGSLIDHFNDSLPVDKRLSDEDINGSIAYAGALRQAGVLSQKEMKNIQKSLLKLRKQFCIHAYGGSAEGTGKQEKTASEKKNIKAPARMTIGSGGEDIHTAVEAALTKMVRRTPSRCSDTGRSVSEGIGAYESSDYIGAGKSAGKIHTGRSRNEQVVADERLYLLKTIPQIEEEIKGLQKTILNAAQKYLSVIMPGYTHLQQAQPVLFSYYLMNWFFALQRDKERLADCYKRVDICPYGSGALAGNSYKIDRHKLAKKLGFGAVSENALDAVSDRDFIIEFISASAILMMHLSRFAEDIIIWSSAEFGFVRLAEGIATSSSLMPQKHNPDTMELIRGKTGRVYGNLVSIMTVMKGLPSGYNKDMQEDKTPMFDTIDTVRECLRIFALSIKTMKIFPERMKESINSFTLATDLADYLVKKGIPFRQSHHIVSKLVRYAIEKGKKLHQLNIAELKKFSGIFDKDVYKIFDMKKSIEAKQSYGGTSTKTVKKQIEIGKKIC